FCAAWSSSLRRSSVRGLVLARFAIRQGKFESGRISYRSCTTSRLRSAFSSKANARLDRQKRQGESADRYSPTFANQPAYRSLSRLFFSCHPERRGTSPKLIRHTI